MSEINEGVYEDDTTNPLIRCAGTGIVWLPEAGTLAECEVKSAEDGSLAITLTRDIADD